MGIGQGRYIFFPNLDEFGGILNVSKKNILPLQITSL